MISQNKKYKTAIVAGKFYPPHRGHKYLIDTALAQSEQVTVLVCGKKTDKIPAELRASWLQEIHPTVRILLIDDTLPESDSAVWGENTIRWLGYAPEAVFSSENYGDTWAKAMGVVHVCVDKAREKVPISGTEVRRILEEFLEPPVKAYFVPRVCVVGAESTGTTTMTKALAKHYQTVWVPEFGRLYWEAKMNLPKANDWSTDEFVYIAKKQSEIEDEIAKLANQVVISDTDAFATSIWHERYMGYASAEVKQIAAPRRYELYLLTDVDIPFTQDGTRDGEHIREWMHKRFEDELKLQKKNYAVLSGTHEQRLQKATYLIDRIIADSSI